MSPTPHTGELAPAASWRDTHEREHFVQFYEQDAVLLESVGGFIRHGLDRDAAAVVIATQAHLDALERRWRADGFDLEALRRHGRYVPLEAAATLAKFVFDGRPRRERFAEVVGSIIATASEHHGRVVAFGEMVALLWAEANYAAAIELEELWNELSRAHSFALFCAYPLNETSTRAADPPFQGICAAHGHVIPAESYTHARASDRLKIVSRLQQKARSLEREIAARESIERKLARREQELSDFLENAPVPMHSVGPDGLILWANEAELRLLGYSREEYVGHHIAQFHVDSQIISAILERLLAGGALRDEPARLRCKGGSIKDVLINSNAQWEEGQFVRTRCFTRDVTELRRNERLYRALGESINYGIWICDAEGRNLYASESFLKLVGLTQQQCSEFGWSEVLHPEDAAQTIAAWKECVRTGGMWDIEHRFRGVDGRYHPVLARGVPVRDERGTVICWAGINLDIARLKRAEEALRDADRRKDEFLAILAHELRNPLAPIRYAVSIAQRTGRTEEQRRRAEEIIERQVGHMARLLDDLLDVSRITRGVLELRKSRIELTSAIATAIEVARPLLDEKRHTLSVELPKTPVRLEADPVRLAQIFSNLLTNAAKYTDPGGEITLAARQEDGHARVTVRDNGVGIAPEMIPRLFTLFSQADSALKRSEGGLGIGLALVRGLVTLHGGRIEAHSAGLGRGSEFTIQLPMGARAGEAAGEEPQVLGNGAEASLKVLVADDNADNLEACATLLRLCGHQVQVAGDGRQALELAEHFRPHVVLLDIGMPRLNGYEVARAIRAAPWGREMMLLSVTGWGQEEDRRRAFAAGFNHHLTKPLDQQVLESLLQGAAVH